MIRPPLESMSYPRTGCPPIHLPFRRAADILSRVRSEMISRSNCAKCGAPHYAQYAERAIMQSGSVGESDPACISMVLDSALSRLEQGSIDASAAVGSSR